MVVKTWEGDDWTIKVDYDKCTGAGDCVDVCPAEVFELVDEKAVASNVEECIECCSCVEACPEAAIEHSSC
ncbi:MAG: indolepyruvate ferredoxin oxidoreductase subunit alpha [Candidatus Hydrothermarchaeales archaeon]